MFERLIDALTLDYTFVAKARNRMTREELDSIAHSAMVKVKYAPQALIPADAGLTEEDEKDLQECGLIADHVLQMAEWIEQMYMTEIMG